MNTNKAHILKKHGAFYAATKRSLDQQGDRGIKYVKMDNHIWCPPNMKYALECALKKLERKS